MLRRILLWLSPIMFIAVSAAGAPAQAGGYHGGYYGHRSYGDCADDWRYCDRYLRDDAPYYYRRGHYGGGHHKHRYHRHGYRHHNFYGYRNGHNGHGYGRGRGFGHGYGYGHSGYACDPDGDRCYRSLSPYWDYREYYRRHGYHWID
jgi:hypothetical protein